MNELIPVIMSEIAGHRVQAVSLRVLHERLGVGRDFSNWAKDRIVKYGFIENQDFVIVEGLTSPNLATSKSRARTTIEYHSTMQMAKELAMVENNDIGRAIRRYLIEVEERTRQLTPDLIEEIHRTNGMCKTLVKKISEHDKAIDALVESTAHLKAASELGMDRLIELTAKLNAMAAPRPDMKLTADIVSAHEVVEDMAKVPDGKRYRNLSARVSKRLCQFVGARNIVKLPTYPGTKDGFPRALVQEWLDKGGKERIWTWVNEHWAKKAGQNVLPFPKGTPEKAGA